MCLVALTASAACGDSKVTTADAVSTTVPPSPAETTATTKPPPSVQAECTDPAGDVPGGADLVKATLALDDEMLTVTYDLGGDIGPAPDGASWVILATQGSGNAYESYQLGFKMVNDEVFRFFTDLSGNKNEYFETPYTANARRVVTSFPLAALKKLQGSFSWRAVTTLAGDDADACPAEGTLPFAL